MTTIETREITNSEDIIDVRDVIARVEYLEDFIDEDNDDYDVDLASEYATLTSLLSDLEGNGGDEEWRGSWYPITMIRESYFKDYARELADDIGAINAEATWPNSHIDWQSAAEELKGDYSETELEGVTYYYR